ncbi:MAG: hypothetical protein ABI637_07755 [Gemmatimonadota bacterium]
MGEDHGILGILGLLALLAWIALRWRRRLRGTPAEIDHEELEAAERDVRDLESGAGPDDSFPGDDWGPGASRPRAPDLR